MVDLLWRDVDESRARNAFRQALHRLRSALGEDILPQDRERLRLVRSDQIVVDLDAFESSANAGRLEEAIEAYSGDFLEDATLGEPPFDMWAEQERTRIRARFRQILQDAVSQAAASGRWLDAIARVRRLLAVAPFETGAAQLAATTLLGAGRRLEAQEVLRQFGARLGAELGLPMPAELQSLLARIERQAQSGANAAPSSSSAQRDLVLPFVGREGPLSQLLMLCRTTGSDSGALALVEAEAGLGKSRLVAELASHAKSLGPISVLTGRERASGAQLPYGIFAEALRPLVRAPGVVGASKHLLAEAARLLPELRDAFDLPEVRDVEDDGARLRFFEGVAALIDAAAFERPILLVLEDLQFIAPSSLDLLAYLAVRLAGSAVVFILTVRTAEASSGTLTRLRAFAQASAVSSPPHGPRALALTLAPLSAAEASVAGGAAAKAAGIPDAVVQRIVQRSEGHPGQLIELFKRASAGEDVANLPVSARDLIRERLQRLSSAQRRLFLVLALVGRPISLGLAAAASHLSETAAAESLDTLAREGLVERDGSRFSAMDFAAECATEAAGAASRGFLSGWIAEALAREHDASPAELARFYAAAGQSSPAFESARRAAYAALAVGAVVEATQFLHLARTFAATPQQQAEIESFLTTLGSGRRRLGSTVGVPQDSPPTAPPAPPPSPEIDVERIDRVDAASSGWRALFPNWRMLLGAAIATLVISAIVLAPQPTLRAATRLSDTLVVSEGESGRAFRYVTGALTTGFSTSERVAAPLSDPPWMDSLARPWVGPIASPRGVNVAVSRVTAAGSDIFVISADRRDTTVIAAGQGDARPLGWSPDGRWLLATISRTLADGSFDSDLFAYRLARPVVARAIDSTSRRAITEAAWSPDGSRIAWVARVGAERQLEVFTSRADGSDIQNLSRHPADDFHIAWSGDGELLAFTSIRDGNAELYAAALTEHRLWRLTRDPAQDDRGEFSANGRVIAFESTRGGAAGVYVMPSLGGDARLVGAGLTLSVVRWLGGERRYVDRVRVDAEPDVEPGDTGSVGLAAMDQFDERATARDVEWMLLDSSLVRPIVSPDSNDGRLYLIARRPGLARVVGSVGHWRFDTAFVRIGAQPLVLIAPDEADPLRAWQPLGVPLPTTLGGGPASRGAILLNADREWDSGVLSRASVPLLPGLSFSATLTAPFVNPLDAATGISAALVAPEGPAAIDPSAPQFLRYASLSWNADAGRFVYAVGREVYTEPASIVGSAAEIAIRLVVERDSTVSFFVAGTSRWRSTLRVIDPRHGSRVQAWIAGHATGDGVRVSRASLSLLDPRSVSSP